MPEGYEGDISNQDWGGAVESSPSFTAPAASGLIAVTSNLLAGDGAGNATDSTIDPTKVVQVQSPLPATPVILADVIALLQSYGLCQ